ncbi:YtxH domain-containing protein [Humibacter sp.]|uniref:YtxH domain-containing protein n=1 Tax=Humibacter sp. TaxID=1940291 RepID=UPI003F7DFA2C
MKGKVLFVVGLGVGYVLGTRAGRQRYEQIKSAWLKVWDSPAVQKQVHSVQDYTADRIGDLGTVVTENIKKAVTKSNGSASKSDESTASTTTSGTTTGSATKSGATTGRSRQGRTRTGGSGSGGRAS